jgi:hypothetical protein
MAEQLASLLTIDECEDGRFVSDSFARVFHIQPPCKELPGGLIICSPAPLEVSDIVRSLVDTLKVLGERNLNVEPCLDGVFCQVIDPLPHGAR